MRSALDRPAAGSGPLVLVIDDDPFTRKALHNVLLTFGCRIIEASTGLDGLRLISEEKPQLVLLDIRMPGLGGVEVLRELRRTPKFRELPVMAISGDTDRAVVMQLVELGITGFLVKPLFREEATQRLRPILTAVARGETPAMAAGRKRVDDRPSVVFADIDTNFLAFVKGLLEGTFCVHTATTGVDAHDCINAERPVFAVIGSGLPMLGEGALARLLRAANVETRLILLDGGATIPSEAASLFHGVLRKTFVPDVFLADLRKTGLLPQTLDDSLTRLVSVTLRSALVSAVQQSLGVLAARDVRVWESHPVESIQRDVEARVTLALTDRNQSLVLIFACAVETAEALGSQILGGATTLDEGARDAMAEIVCTIAGRFRVSLAEHDCASSIGFPSTSDPAALPTPVLAQVFATEQEEWFLVELHIVATESPS
jgi:CheY-like chemotaxis protein